MIRDIFASGYFADRDPTHATLVDIQMDNFVLHTHIILKRLTLDIYLLFRLPSCKTLPTRTSSSLYLTHPSRDARVSSLLESPLPLPRISCFSMK
jgi:hypothetical protein